MPKTGKKTGRSQPVPDFKKPSKQGTQRNSKHFRWSFEKCLWEHTGWQDCPDFKAFTERIVTKLQYFQEMTWQEILDASGGKSKGNGNNNHFITGDKLPRPERDEFIKLKYMERYEKVFSLRLSGKERLIGIEDNATFFILWYDAKHRFF